MEIGSVFQNHGQLLRADFTKCIKKTTKKTIMRSDVEMWTQQTPPDILSPRDSLSTVICNSLKRPVLGSPQATLALISQGERKGGCQPNYQGDHKWGSHCNTLHYHRSFPMVCLNSLLHSKIVSRLLIDIKVIKLTCFLECILYIIIGMLMKI